MLQLFTNLVFVNSTVRNNCCKDSEGFTALMRAAENGNVEVVKSTAFPQTVLVPVVFVFYNSLLVQYRYHVACFESV